MVQDQQDEHMEKKKNCLHKQCHFLFSYWAMEVDYPDDEGSLPLTFPWVPESIKETHTHTHLTFTDFLTKTQ